jgi:hypothetical protein
VRLRALLCVLGFMITRDHALTPPKVLMPGTLLGWGRRLRFGECWKQLVKLIARNSFSALCLMYLSFLVELSASRRKSCRYSRKCNQFTLLYKLLLGSFLMVFRFPVSDWEELRVHSLVASVCY